eukprot:CAMPEP_0180421438 /NCGR_PEP_ID=MMETSP1036_2-20121128/3154_1 /TAXON_ID=632150 /ORGANISM="Azadinium spinosum, Strain 3D9" /LENGTH=107 /DNA_ID=CAMNT_0022426709 /DNA_START=128 /DNA_END=451 /DNA_ORIENTATION=+
MSGLQDYASAENVGRHDHNMAVCASRTSANAVLSQLSRPVMPVGYIGQDCRCRFDSRQNSMLAQLPMEHVETMAEFQLSSWWSPLHLQNVSYHDSGTQKFVAPWRAA